MISKDFIETVLRLITYTEQLETARLLSLYLARIIHECVLRQFCFSVIGATISALLNSIGKRPGQVPMRSRWDLPVLFFRL